MNNIIKLWFVLVLVVDGCGSAHNDEMEVEDHITDEKEEDDEEKEADDAEGEEDAKDEEKEVEEEEVDD